MLSPRLIPPAQAALAAIAAATPAPAVGPEPGTTEAAIAPLFPQKERDLKKGLPSGMTAGSFWASRGITKPTMLPDGKVLTDDFEGPIPYGVHTLWNVVETESDDPVAAALRKVVCGRAPSGWCGAATRAVGANTAVSRSRHSLIASLRGMVAAAVLIPVFAVIPLGPDRAELADVPLKELQAFIDSNRPVDVATNDPVRVRNWPA